MGYTVTVAEAARRLGVSVQAVYKRIKNGTLDAVQVNRRWLLSDEEGSICIAPPPGRPRRGTQYVLMNGPYPVMEFSYMQESGSFKIYTVLDAARAPFGTVTRNGKGKAEALQTWWEHRVIPASRAGMDAKLAQLGLEDPAQIPFRNLGFSLSDQYWICPAGEDLSWEELNYFRNPFGPQWTEGSGAPPWDEWLAQVGLSSPDNTSEGVLPKRWVCRGEERILLKGCNPWCDQQLFNEVVATMLHRRLLGEGEYVPYQLVLDARGDAVACACPCFVAEDEEFIPASQVLETQGRYAGESPFDALVRLGGRMGMPQRQLEEFLSKMIVCDSIIANGDRHMRNFGFIRDIDSLRMRPAPLFDSGNSLWFDATEDAVARRDWSFTARPFDGIPNRQLFYAGSMSWLDPAALEGFAEEAEAFLEDSVFAVARLPYIRGGIESRIAAVLSMR